MNRPHTVSDRPSSLPIAGPADAARRFRLTNQTRDKELADSVEVADTAASRSKGLLGRKSLEPGTALWIVPCESVHTFFMQFPLDLVYLDRQRRVVKIRRNIPPWRISICLRAHSVLEFPAGAVLEDLAGPGDELLFTSIAGTQDEK
jgi:uncharacterized protein